MHATQIILALILTLSLILIINAQESGTVTDIDGNVYQTVKIGDQLWMAENLRVTRYRNGDAIPTGLSNTAWQNSTEGAYAIYPHSKIAGLYSDAEVVAAYGLLYNWYAVDDSRGLCHDRWRVPEIEDWKQLIIYLGTSVIEADKTGWRGAENNVGGKLKSTRTEPSAHPRWRRPNTGATNELGWYGVSGGTRYSIGDFHRIGFYGYWWSSTERDTEYALLQYLLYDFKGVGEYYYSKHSGYSVRCLKD